MKLHLSKVFERDLDRLVRKNATLDQRVRKALKLLVSDPNYPSLRLHKIKGSIYSVSVDMKIRILIEFKDGDILLLDIGTHDEIYG